MLKAKKRGGRWYSRKRGFVAARKKAYERDGDRCPVSGELLYVIVGHHRQWFRACDHIWPEKIARLWWPRCNPHILDNLLTIRPTVHAKKTAVEAMIYCGNMTGFFREMEHLGYPRALFTRAAASLAKSAAERNTKIV